MVIGRGTILRGRGYAVSDGGKPDEIAFRIAARKAVSATRAACHKICFRCILPPSKVCLLIRCRGKHWVVPDASESVLRGYVSWITPVWLMTTFLYRHTVISLSYGPYWLCWWGVSLHFFNAALSLRFSYCLKEYLPLVYRGVRWIWVVNNNKTIESYIRGC